MSLSIDVGTVTAVLLTDGTWYDVEDQSFDLDSYEYVHDGRTIHGGVTRTGFRFTSHGSDLVGPLTAILAVRIGEPRGGGADSVEIRLG